MNCAIARCRRATCPFITTKRAPASFAAASKSRPPSPDVDMVPGLEIECSRLAPAAQLHAVLGPAAERNAVVRNIGDLPDELMQSRLHGGVLRLHLPQLVGELGPLPHQRGRLRFVLLRLGLADLPGERVALGLQLLGGGLDPLSRILERLERSGVEVVAARRETPGERVDVGPEQLYVDHSPCLRACSFLRRSSASFSRIFASRPRSVGRYQSSAPMPSGR